MKILGQLAVLLGICLVGEAAAYLLPIPFPAGVISMVILLTLFLGIIKLKHISEVGDFLLKNMALFFIPAGVSIIEYIPVIKPVILPFLAVCIISTFITFAAAFLAVRLTSSAMAAIARRKEHK